MGCEEQRETESYIEEESLAHYKSQATKAAKDSCYGYKVMAKIEDAKTIGEIERIMRTARHDKFG